MRALVVFESMFGNTEAIADGELDRARRWGERLASMIRRRATTGTAP